MVVEGYTLAELLQPVSLVVDQLFCRWWEATGPAGKEMLNTKK